MARTFKLSTDKHFVGKLEDVVDLDVSSPEHAEVFSCDEKSQIQALDTASGKVIGICMNKRRHQEWIRFHFHFTPTSASWLNMVERFFCDLREKQFKRGLFRSVPELVEKIEHDIAVHNEAAKPFIWTCTASDILEKIK